MEFNLEITGAIGLGGLLLGWVIRGTRTWTGKAKDLEILTAGHSKLREEFDAHDRNKAIHIDPPRDSAAMQGLRNMLSDGLTMMHDKLDEVQTKLDRIDERCERRGQTCAEHFSRVEQRIAASTGKINGDPK